MWNRPTHVLTRAELYDLVWSEPVETIARRYKLSGNGLAKICKKHRIPLPPRGYWAKVQHGQQPRRVSLRPAKTSDDETVRITEGMGPRPSPLPKPALEPSIAAAVERVLQPENRIVLAENTGRPHRLVSEAAQILDRPSWDGKRKAPDPIELRRRRILSAFFRGVERVKGSVEGLDAAGFFSVELYGSSFRLSCSEPERRLRVPLDAKEMRNRPSWETRDWKTESRPSGVLRLRVLGDRDRHKDFVDAVGAPLEDRLTDVLVFVLRQTITVAERDRRAEAERQAKAEAERRRHEEEIRRWELEDQRRKERERVAVLIEQTGKWRQAEDIRAFVAAAKDAAWAAWALRVADAIDPLKAP
jgi:hypothetical protein